MSLTTDLISQFVKATNDDKKSKQETTVYGTVVAYDGKNYVRFDGSDMLTPASMAVDAAPGERVAIMLKDHHAVVTSNITSPTARNVTVVEVVDRVQGIDKIIADVVTTDELNAQTARIDTLEANDVTITGRLEANEAAIKDLKVESLDAETLYATFATIKNLDATNAEIETLDAKKLNAADATIIYAKIADLDATNANVTNLTGTFGDFQVLTTDNFTAVNASIGDLEANKLSATDIEGKYANIDFSNIGKAAMEYFYAESGLIENVTVGDTTITGKLVGVTISGDRIEANTLIADKLVIQGEDGLYYKLNTDGIAVEAEQTDYNSLNGSVIKAQSITASKISVDDLVAFDATIGGFNITESAIYSGVKESATNTTRGIYLDNDGQMALGDASKFVKYYKDANGNYKLEISADSVTLTAGDQNIATAIAEVSEATQANTEDLTAYMTATDSELASLQQQIDGSITTWFYEYEPTNSNAPASAWTTTDLKNVHLGDLFYDTITGYCYRWQVQNNTYSWNRITDVDVTKALADAHAAQDTADNKRRVFVSTPTPPYDVGDLWSQGSTGDLLRCRTAKTTSQSYAAADWVKASKYTDDTVATAAQNGVNALTTRMSAAETNISQNSDAIALRATKTELTESLGNYYTKEQSDSKLTVKANEITSNVASTYATKTALDTTNSKVTAAQTTADNAKADVTALKTRVAEAETSITQNAEDIELRATKTEVETAKSQAVATAKANTLSELENYSTTAEMNSAIEVNANEITSSVSSTYATKTALNTTNKNLSALTTRTTTAETNITQLSNKITANVTETTKLGTRMTTMEQNAEGFNWSVEEDLRDEMSSIQFGGRNLLSDTTVPSTNKKAAPYNKYLSDSGNSAYMTGAYVAVNDLPIAAFTHVYQFTCTTVKGYNSGRSLTFYSNDNAIPMINGRVYTMSMYARTVSGEGAIRFQVGTSSWFNSGFIPITTEWDRYSWTFTYTDESTGGSNGTKCYYGANCNMIGVVQTFGWKLEVGDRASDWTPSVEDVRYESDQASKTATNFMSYDSTNGLQIGNKTSGSWSGTRAQITDSAFNILDSSGATLSSYGTETVIGKTSAKNVYINSNGVNIRNGTTNIAWFDQYGLKITNKNDASGSLGSGTSKPALVIGSESAYHIEMDNNEIMAKSDATTSSHLFLNMEGGNVSVNNNADRAFMFQEGSLYAKNALYRDGEWYGIIDAINDSGNTTFGYGGYHHSQGGTNIYGNILRFYTNDGIVSDRNLNLLATCTLYMNAEHSVSLSGAVSSQLSGIVLAWSWYADGAAANHTWNYTFIPKDHVLRHSGGGICCPIQYNGAYIHKYVYVTDSTITGNATNNSDAAHRSFVLRYIYGV